MLTCYRHLVIMRKKTGLSARCFHYFLMATGGLLAFSVYFSLTATTTQSMRDVSSVFKRLAAAGKKAATRGITLSVLEPRVSHLNRTSHKLLKIYIYNLNSIFNTDISRCVHSEDACFDYSNHGMGKLLYRHGQISIHNTNQFSLDVILHHQFAHSRYRTNDPSEADVFYVPAYMGSMYFCHKYDNRTAESVKRLFHYLNTMPYFRQGKPHVTTLAKIEREQIDVISAHPAWKNLTYMIIEKDDLDFRKMLGIESQRAIVVPYPSYIHFNYTKVTDDDAYAVENVSKYNRKLFLFFAASLRRTNPFRVKLIDQFVVKTELGFKEYFKSNDVPNRDQVMLITWECLGNHYNTTIEWMFNSVFCLQPHGDSPTRKSFYDSILSGCIPVVFQFPNENVEFPFQRALNYNDFIVRIPVNRNGDLEENIPIYDYLHKIPLTEISRLQTNLIKVLHLFQYPVIGTEQNSDEKDALEMIVDEIRVTYNL
ncbi:xyloglucan galactosyltransferase MUR3-like isoform X2 [Gigantopelta aegis]|nr:xyloglucan galactosyltransferase MUR3-like isoform X2 [Gigantopelta aegis]XP_041352967.1 xyloglucan galactosyltransferase MUR3-like isoform X2 [Gigantopelta aegis]